MSLKNDVKIPSKINMPENFFLQKKFFVGILKVNDEAVIPDPDFYPSRIPDPKTAPKERGEKNIFCKHFFVATNFTKCKIILLLNCSRKKFWPNFKELWNFLPKKLSLRYQKYEFGIRDPE
jgi:hypothetical protein